MFNSGRTLGEKASAHAGATSVLPPLPSDVPSIESFLDPHLLRFQELMQDETQSVERYSSLVNCLREIEIATERAALLAGRGPVRLGYSLAELEWEQRCKLDSASRQKYEEPMQFLRGPATHMREAFKFDYENWMRGYLERGGAVTNSYSSLFPVRDFILAVEDFHMTPLRGSFAIGIIVPTGVRMLGGDPGDSTIYLMKDFELIGRRAGIYSDLKIGK
jgi:hypothetical protein